MPSAEMLGAFLSPKYNIMAKRKLSYKDATKKKEVRDFLFSLFADLQLKKVVGLAGPDINDYLEFCKSKGYEEFEIWENHAPTLMKQIRDIRVSKVELKYGNILNTSEDRHNVLFDLDYCVTVRYMQDHIKKFKDKFIMTFARRIKDEETISSFFSIRGETILSKLDRVTPLLHTIYKSTGGKYIFINYRDTSNMCCIAKIN
jgi:hypothetical protein